MPRASTADAPITKDAIRKGSITYYPELIQGCDEWLQARCALLTASEMKLILTPTLKMASNDKERAHLYELAAQRINKYVEPHYISDDMLRGHEDEIEARALYAKHFAPVQDMGFITNDEWGFTLGYSPDGLVGEVGAIEAKSRRQKFQFETWVEFVTRGEVPPDYLLQHQTGMLVADLSWIDFLSFCGGMPMVRLRVYPDDKIKNAIVETSGEFERRLAEKMAKYDAALKSAAPFIATERKIVQEMFA
jgi:hypothetical protein